MLRLKDGLVALALILPTAMQAQANCADREAVVASLTTKYGEAFAGGGLQNSEQILEVWFSEEKGTWTVLMTRANGRTCIMASGTNWQDPGEVKLPAGIPG
ncbi:MAG: hypothetical protein LJE62_07990 [Silicimonas sp.]|jgi:hypothetical protein|nr:hypothetical protein [Silicimonas sp.]